MVKLRFSNKNGCLETIYGIVYIYGQNNLVPELNALKRIHAIVLTIRLTLFSVQALSSFIVRYFLTQSAFCIYRKNTVVN